MAAEEGGEMEEEKEMAAAPEVVPTIPAAAAVVVVAAIEPEIAPPLPDEDGKEEEEEEETAAEEEPDAVEAPADLTTRCTICFVDAYEATTAEVAFAATAMPIPGRDDVELDCEAERLDESGSWLMRWSSEIVRWIANSGVIARQNMSATTPGSPNILTTEPTSRP